MFPEFAMTAAIQEYDQKEIKLEVKHLNFDKNIEDERIFSNTRNKDEELVKFTENVPDIKNEIEIDDYRISYNNNFKVEVVDIIGDMKCDPVTAVRHNNLKKCKYETNHWHSLKEHPLVHSDIKIYECEVCKRRFRRIHNLKAHRLTHSQDKKFLCGHCDYKTYQKYYLLRHLKNNHGDGKNKEYKCYVCGYEPKKKCYLNQHLKRHSVDNNNEFKCTLCDYQTVHYRYLKAHIKVNHDSVKEYTCPKCEYRTNVKCNINRHLTIHSDYRPYECNVCNKRFKRKFRLMAHGLVHSEEKRFHCAHCDYKCNRKDGLKRHLKSMHIKQRRS